MKLYRVEFTFNDDYRPKVECIRSINLTVLADGQFASLAVAWERISPLQLGEPKSFNATRIEAE